MSSHSSRGCERQIPDPFFGVEVRSGSLQCYHNVLSSFFLERNNPSIAEPSLKSTGEGFCFLDCRLLAAP